MELVSNFLEVKKGLIRLKFNIICTVNKFWKNLKIKIRIGKWSLGLVEICLELKRIFENTIEFLMNFERKIWKKWKIIAREISRLRMPIERAMEDAQKSAPLLAQDDATWRTKGGGVKKRSNQGVNREEPNCPWYFPLATVIAYYKRPSMQNESQQHEGWLESY